MVSRGPISTWNAHVFSEARNCFLLIGTNDRQVHPLISRFCLPLRIFEKASSRFQDLDAGTFSYREQARTAFWAGWMQMEGTNRIADTASCVEFPAILRYDKILLRSICQFNIDANR